MAKYQTIEEAEMRGSMKTLPMLAVSMMLAAMLGCESPPDEVGNAEPVPELPDEWEQYYFTRHRCSVHLPKGHLPSVDTMNVNGNQAVIYSSQCELDDCAILIEFTDGLDLSKYGDVDAQLEKVVERTLAYGEKKELRSNRRIRLFGHPGREITFWEQDGKVLRRNWIVMVGESLFQANFVRSPNAEQSRRKELAFFNSIRFASDRDAAEVPPAN